MFEIDRIAVILRPTRQFAMWLKEIPDQAASISLDDLRSDCTALLIPDFAEPADAYDYLDENCITIIENELECLEIDEQWWPEALTPDLFHAWYDIECHSLVYDASIEEQDLNSEDETDAAVME